MTFPELTRNLVLVIATEGNTQAMRNVTKEVLMSCYQQGMKDANKLNELYSHEKVWR